MQLSLEEEANLSQELVTGNRGKRRQSLTNSYNFFPQDRSPYSALLQDETTPEFLSAYNKELDYHQHQLLVGCGGEFCAAGNFGCNNPSLQYLHSDESAAHHVNGSPPLSIHFFHKIFSVGAGNIRVILGPAGSTWSETGVPMFESH